MEYLRGKDAEKARQRLLDHASEVAATLRVTRKGNAVQAVCDAIRRIHEDHMEAAPFAVY